MAEVHAIKDLDTVRLIGHLLKKNNGRQMADIWHIGINLALRISDLLSVKFEHIQNGRLLIKESKTGKSASIVLNDKAASIVTKIRSEYPNHTYLFQSFKNPASKGRPAKPLTRRAVTYAFAQVGEELSLRLGTHSMRKTRGYHLYKQTGDIGRVMKMLRHSSEAMTLRYIGITQDDVDRDFQTLQI